jgi:acyl-CoA thioesterase-1
MLLTALATLAVVLAGGATPVLGRDGDDGERCARFALQSQARERVVTGSGREVAVLGDSYSVGLGLRAPERSWAVALPGRVRVHGFSGSGFAAGSSPCRGASFAERVGQLPDTARTVVVQGGVNDVDRPATEIVAGVQAVLRRLEDRTVLVVGPAPAPRRAARVTRVDAILARECRRAGVAYLSMLDRDLTYLGDRLHLTPTGHATFGEAVAAGVARLVSSAPAD